MIPVDGFYGLDQVGEFTIPIGCKSIGEGAFAWCDRLTSITSKSTNLSIGESAFACCQSLERGIDLTKLNNLTKIPNSLYSSCYKLKGVIIPDTVTKIGDYAFAYCKGLDGITIPSSVISIGGYALTDMTHVFIKATTPPVISSSTFSKGTTLHVPVGCGDAYRNAQYYGDYTIVEG